jgi:NADH-quinone oxidoreductase subunit A
MFINFYTLSSYFPILIFLCFAVVVSSVLLLLPIILNDRTAERKKLSQYECGSEVVGEGRTMFDARFYLVAMLFIIFDLEIIYIFPWAVSLGSIGGFGFGLAMLFLFILALGFVYEWKKGALDWE